MPKGIITNTKGRPGAKNKPETSLLKTFTHAWLLKWGQAGFNTWADEHPTEAVKVALAFMPKTPDETPGPVAVTVNFHKA